ncbi:MAG: hypothetical protein K2O16_20200 [Lachnospiraceae bacterium]|nr:hypothetical protein [Lachnospiraceae bacterium]
MQISNFSVRGEFLPAKRARQITPDSSEEFCCAVTKVDKGVKGGKLLGMTMCPEEGQLEVYGMTASLLESSTPDKPIVQVVSNINGEKEIFHIDISQIDPEHASRMEMFALCSYADKCGTGTGSTFGSFHTFKMYEETAKQNGILGKRDERLSAWEQFRNEKVNWIQSTEAVLNVLKAFDDPSVLDLFSKGKKLLYLYSKYAVVSL